MKLLNLGCGYRYNKEWTNVDFVSTGPGVQAHNLLQGIPFADNTFDAVYHSHVLEHFTRTDAGTFIKECYRVLKPGGIIRIAIPDLEKIATLYLQKLNAALQGDAHASKDYDWIMLEMYDQTVRTKSGGDMMAYLQQDVIPNEAFVFERLGEEARHARTQFLSERGRPAPPRAESGTNYLSKLFSPSVYVNQLKKLLFKKELEAIKKQEVLLKLGAFRLGGEIHQWMYDRYSLNKLLTETGFHGFKVKSAFESNIPDWSKYELESKNGIVYKPDSLFVEAVK